MDMLVRGQSQGIFPWDLLKRAANFLTTFLLNVGNCRTPGKRLNCWYCRPIFDRTKFPSECDAWPL
jgi:hypothetical protein